MFYNVYSKFYAQKAKSEYSKKIKFVFKSMS